MSENNEEIQEETQEEIQNQHTKNLPKYSVVMRFWSTPQEIEVDDIILCQDTYTHEYYYQFFDSTGRLWKNVPKSDVILIENYPGKKSTERYFEIKKQIVEYEKEELKCKPREVDVSIS